MVSGESRINPLLRRLDRVRRSDFNRDGTIPVPREYGMLSPISLDSL